MTFGRITITRTIKAIAVVNIWNGITPAPALKPSLAKNICSAQKIENIRTLNAGEEEDEFMVLSCEVLEGDFVRFSFAPRSALITLSLMSAN